MPAHGGAVRALWQHQLQQHLARPPAWQCWRCGMRHWRRACALVRKSDMHDRKLCFVGQPHARNRCLAHQHEAGNGAMWRPCWACATASAYPEVMQGYHTLAPWAGTRGATWRRCRACGAASACGSSRSAAASSATARCGWRCATAATRTTPGPTRRPAERMQTSQAFYWVTTCVYCHSKWHVLPQGICCHCYSAVSRACRMARSPLHELYQGRTFNTHLSTVCCPSYGAV